MTRTRFVLVGAGAAWMACTLLACGWFDSDLQRYSPPAAADATTEGAPPGDSASGETASDGADAAQDATTDGEVKDGGKDAEDASDATENDAPPDANDDAD